MTALTHLRVARPHRADAARNYDAILAAARAAFAEQGAEAPLEEIARRAGTLDSRETSSHHLTTLSQTSVI